MQKRFIAAFLSLTLTLGLLSGCAGSAPASGTESTAPSSQAKSSGEAAPATDAPPADATATAGKYKGKFVFVSVDSLQRSLGKVVEEYKTANPEMEFEHVFFDSTRFAELFTAMRNSGEQVDILHLNPQDLRRYALAGDLLDLSGEAIDWERYRPVGVDTYIVNNKKYGVPLGSIGGFNIYYNKTILDKYNFTYPETYADLVTIGQTLKKDGISAYTHAGKNIYLWPVWFFSTYAQVTKGESKAFTFDTLQGKRKFTDPEVVQALDMIFQFSRDGLFIDGVNSTDDDASIANIVTGRAVFALGLDWLAVKQAQPENVELDVALLPYLSEEKAQPQYPGGPGLALTVSSTVDDARKQACLDFIDFITADEKVEFMAKEENWPTSTNVNVGSVSTEPMIQKFDKELSQHMEVYLDWYWPPEITRAFQEGIQMGVDGRKSAEEVAKDIQTVFDKLVADGYTFVS